MPLDLLPDDTQQALSEAADALLDAEASAAHLRSRPKGEVRSRELWDRAADQGWFSISIPEVDGGLGLGLLEQGLVHRALGRTLTPGPYLGTTLAAGVAHWLGSPWLKDIMAGQPVGLMTATGEAQIGSRVIGTFRTDDACDAARWLVLTPSGAALFDAIDLDPLPRSLDLSARSASAQLDRESAQTLAGPESWSCASVLVACQLAGIADAAVRASARYTKVREQFGRAIGSFQMVQQRLADMATRADGANQLSALAALAVQANRPGADQLAASALLIASDAALQNSRDDIQNHGGLGYTWVVDSHLRLRRAHGLAALLGDAESLRSRVLKGESARPW